MAAVGGGLRSRTPSYVTQRLCAALIDAWDTLDGQWALEGVDPHSWTLTRLLRAAEVLLDRLAADDAERERMRAQLYAPPHQRARPTRVPGGTRRPPHGSGMTQRQAQELIARVAAEDSNPSGGRTRGR